MESPIFIFGSITIDYILRGLSVGVGSISVSHWLGGRAYHLHTNYMLEDLTFRSAHASRLSDLFFTSVH